ncbi:MAG: hypothetical protein MR270_05835 [Erysipelotrichaceae bacterium]|nr:hypothetical protein [Erysipelotrichaceae bacterium]
MRKLVRSFLLFCLFLLLPSCSNNNSKFMLQGNIENKSSIQISNIELENKITNCENFVLIVSLVSCATCERFISDVINPYVSSTYSTIYNIDYYELEEGETYKNKPYVKISPSIFIYYSGKVVSSKSYDSNNKEFENIEKFKEYMNEYIIEPKIVSINEEYLDTMIEEKQSFVLYIGWDLCGDCKLLNSRILDSYFKSNKKDNILYYLECGKYRAQKPAVEPVESNYETKEEYEIAKNNWQQWIDFASKYNFVSYRNGKVPSLFYYNLGEVYEMLVYHNDVIQDGVVVESFFQECIGKKMSEEELLDYHDKKAIEFLNKYYK